MREVISRGAVRAVIICKVQGHVHMCKYKLPLEAETANRLPRLQPDQQGTQRTRENEVSNNISVGKSHKNPHIKGNKLYFAQRN